MNGPRPISGQLTHALPTVRSSTRNWVHSRSLNNPYGVAVDGSGTFYVADTGHNGIRKVSPSGIITTVAGTGTGAFGGDGGPAVPAGCCAGTRKPIGW